jgi:ribosomal protein L24E
VSDDNDEPVSPDVAAELTASFARALAKAKGTVARLRGNAMPDGRIWIEVTGDDGTKLHVRMDEEHARKWASSFLELCGRARRVKERLNGHHLFICWPDPATRGIYFVRHAGEVRRFRSSVIRAAHTCAACGQRKPPGATMYVQAPKQGGGWPWGNVRLCLACVAITPDAAAKGSV